MKLQGREHLAAKVRLRDNYTCRKCRKLWKFGERKFDTHHIYPDDEGDRSYRNYKKIDEMITLCHKCHLNLFHVREKMKLGMKLSWIKRKAN